MKRFNIKNKKQAGIIASVAVLVAFLLGGGYYLSARDTKTDNQSEQDKAVQENLENKEKQIEETQNNQTSPTQTPSTTTPQTSSPTSVLGTLSDTNITAMRAGDTIYLSVYGIGQGQYEVEKNGQKLTLTEPSYLGSGGLVLPNMNAAETKATYQVYKIENGKRASASKVITVTTNFSGNKTFGG